MARKLTNSNAHFHKALTRLPLGRRFELPLLGRGSHDLRQARARGPGHRHRRQRLRRLPARLRTRHPRLCRSARRRGRPRRHGGRRRVRAVDRARIQGGRAHRAAWCPAAELVRFSNSGTEAVMAGLRLARAYTGRDDYIILEGSYHGLFDAAMWYTPMEKWSQVGDPQIQPYSEGIPMGLRGFAHFVQANDANQLEDVFKRTAGRVACMLIEPIMGNCLGIAAEPEYLRAARALCDKYGVVLLIDEVKTGFRVARGGVQELYGVKADLCTFAKAVANGYPISVLAGREDIMRKFGKGVAHGGTYTAHSVSMAAAETCLEILDETDALERIADYGTRLRNGMHAVLGARGITAQLRRPSVDARAVLRPEPAAQLPRLEGQRLLVLRRDGARCCTTRACCASRIRASPGSSSAAHDDSCLADTLQGLRDRGRRDTERRAQRTGRRASACSTAPEAAGPGGPGPMPGSREQADVIVVGAGHNGLVAACYLARAGLKVLVLERNPTTSAAPRSAARLYQDFTYSNCSYVCSLLRPEIMRDARAAALRPADHPLRRRLHHDARRRPPRDLRQPRRAAPRDRAPLEARRRGLRPLRARRDPAVQVHQAAADARAAGSDLVQAARHPTELLYLGQRISRASASERMYDTLRFWTMSVADFLDEYFESEIVKAHMAGSSIIGTALGPRSPGTAYVLLHHYMGDIDDTVGAWGFARGGMGAVTAALAASLQASGGSIRTGAGVERILVRGGRSVGVVARASGEEIARRNGALEHGRQAHLPRDGRQRGAARRVPAAVRQLQDPRLLRQAQHRARRPARASRRSRPAAPCIRGDLHVTDTIEMMERAYDDWKDGRWSRAPVRRHADPLADRPDHGARRQALHVGVRAVLPVRACRAVRGTRAKRAGLRRRR